MRVAKAIAVGSRDQDRAVVVDLEAALVLGLADGAGGRGGGREAAEAVVAKVEASAARLARANAAECAALLEELDRELAQEPHGGEATSVFVVVRGREVVGASVGDSGAWILAANGVIDLTDRQVRKPCVGVGAAMATAFAALLPAGARLLMASDGLLKYVDRSRVAALGMAMPIDLAVQALVDAARLPSGVLRDDVAVLLVE